MPRYAIYYAPDRHDPLTIAAAEWLGRDAVTGAEISRASMVSQLDDEAFDTSMANARRYGFHGTLKAPFELAEDKSLSDLERALEMQAAKLHPFELPRFVVGQLGPFFALLLEERSLQLSGIAADLVRDFDEFRAPLSDVDIARRNPEKLSESQRSNLIKWGYPYIFDDFRFHMTLSDPIAVSLASDYGAALDEHFGPLLRAPYQMAALSLFMEPERGAPFLLYKQYPLG